MVGGFNIAGIDNSEARLSPGGQERVDLVAEEKRKREELTAAKNQCKANGGRWDEATNSCILPRDPESLKNVKFQGLTDDEREVRINATGKTGAELEAGDAPLQAPEVIRDQDSGVIKGVRMPDGRTILGINEEEVRTITEAALAKRQLPAGAVEGGSSLQQAQRSANIANIGQIGNLATAQEADINFSQAALAGAASAVPGIVGGIATGATVGALGGPIGALGGAIIGGTGAFIAGTLNNIKKQQSGEIGAANIELTDGIRTMRQLAMLASRDPSNADIYITQYNTALTRVYQAREQLKVETAGDLNSWINDGRVELAKMDSFLRDDGGLAGIYGQKLSASLESGVPLSIQGEELLLDEAAQ